MMKRTAIWMGLAILAALAVPLFQGCTGQAPDADDIEVTSIPATVTTGSGSDCCRGGGSTTVAGSSTWVIDAPLINTQSDAQQEARTKCLDAFQAALAAMPACTGSCTLACGGGGSTACRSDQTGSNICNTVKFTTDWTLPKFDQNGNVIGWSSGGQVVVSGLVNRKCSCR